MGREIVGLVIAAGFSFRMKAFKPLLDLGGITALERAVQCFKKGGLQDIRVVVGHRAGELLPKLAGLGAQAIVNEDYAEGMYTSILAGVKSFGQEVQGFMLLPSDIPLIRPQTVQKLLKVYRSTEAGIIYPCFAGTRGHPPLISARYLPQILTFSGEGGLKALLEAYEQEAVEVDAKDRGVLLDMDTPEDYQNLLEYQAAAETPSKAECYDLLRLAGTPVKVIQHGEAVAKLALELASHLNTAGCSLNMQLILAAALLHDIAKGEADHAAAGGRRLHMYPAVAEVIASHTDLPAPPGQALTEKEIIFLVDKLVQEDKLVSLQERFAYSLQKFRQQPKVYAKVTKRLRNAELVKARVEQILATALENILGTQLGGEGQWTINSRLV